MSEQLEQDLLILQIVNHDDQFEMVSTQSGIEPIILNKTDLSDPNYIDYITKQVFSDGTGMDFIARCGCGRLDGNEKIGYYCNICEETVKQSNLLDDNHLICRNWLECPKDLVHGWLNPRIYLNLSVWLSYDKGRRNYIDDILDVTKPIPMEISSVVKGQGFTYLGENFDRIMEFFMFDHPVTSRRPETAAARIFLKAYRHMVFCHYIPILNSAISPLVTHDTSSSSKRQYSDTISDSIIMAATSLSKLEFTPRKRNALFHIEKTTFEAFKNIVDYIEKGTKTYISIKKALPRTHIFGTRYHWSVRGVISPIIGPHRDYELHFPWRMAVNTFRVHINGILLNRYKMPLKDVIIRVRAALQKVDPLIKEIMDELITNTEHIPGIRGIPFLWDRPPSIRDGSVMMKVVTKIKTDIEDGSINVSPIDIKLPNGDFDGDNFAGILLIEKEMVKAFMHLFPSAMVYNKNGCDVTTEVGLNNTTAIPWNRFLGNIA